MSLSTKRKLKSLLYVSIGSVAAFTGICIYKGNEKFYKNYLMPAVHLLDAENAHKLGVFAGKHRLLPKSAFKDPDKLRVSAFGKEFKNPIGIAAGYDKDGEAVLGLKDLGFGFIEVGSVTPEPQPGNERPRVFRLSNDSAVINRYGFNSKGHDAVLASVTSVKSDAAFDGVIGVNLGKNKTSTDPVNDYVTGINKFGPVADYLVVNVSSPNTPGLRALQNKEALIELLTAVVSARDALPHNKPPILLKLAPDLTHQDRKDVAQVIAMKPCKIDGLIVCNTTIERPEGLKSEHLRETGGLSGKPLKEMSTEMIKEMYGLTKGIPIIGVGGVSTGRDAYEKIKAGAVVVQLYTALIYEGPPVVTKIKKEILELLERDGFNNVSEAVGADVKS